MATLKDKFAFIRSQYFKKKEKKEGERGKGAGGTICSPSPTAPNNNLLCIFVNVQGRESVCLRERGQEELAAAVFVSEENAERNHNGRDKGMKTKCT